MPVKSHQLPCKGFQRFLGDQLRHGGTRLCDLFPLPFPLLTFVYYNMDNSTRKEDIMEAVEYKEIAKILGGRKVFGKAVRTSLLWTVQIEKGFPFRALEYLKEALRLSDSEISSALDVSTKTTSRGREVQKDRLPLSVRAPILRFRRNFALPAHVFGDKT